MSRKSESVAHYRNTSLSTISMSKVFNVYLNFFAYFFICLNFHFVSLHYLKVPENLNYLSQK